MAEPEWFFSTLAQASAAIAGLVIAFSAVLYQLERRRREDRTKELREKLIDFKTKYEGLIWGFQSAFRDLVSTQGDAPYDMIQFEEEENIKQDRESLIQTLENEDAIDQVRVWLIWIYLNEINRIMNKIDASKLPKEDYLISEDEFENLKTATDAISHYLHKPDGLDELMDTLSPENNQIFVFSDIFEDFPNPPHAMGLEDWYELEFGGPIPEQFTGKNLHTMNVVFGSIRRDIRTIDKKRGYTILDYSPNVRNAVIASSALLIVGVFLPLMFLFTIPSSVPLPVVSGGRFLIIQCVLLILSAGITGYLLWLLYQNLSIPA